MNIKFYNKLLSSATQFLLILILSACAGENTKPSYTTEPSSHPKNASTASLTKPDRDKYRDGITALNNNELTKAQRIFGEFIRTKPNLAGAYSNLALVYLKKQEIDKSLKLVNKALKLNPKQAQGLNLRAQIYIINGSINKAKDDYLLAIKIKPNYINAQYNIALLYDIYLQEIELAIKHYNIYLSLLKNADDTTKEWVKHLEGTLKNA